MSCTLQITQYQRTRRPLSSSNLTHKNVNINTSQMCHVSAHAMIPLRGFVWKTVWSWQLNVQLGCHIVEKLFINNTTGRILYLNNSYRTKIRKSTQSSNLRSPYYWRHLPYNFTHNATVHLITWLPYFGRSLHTFPFIRKVWWWQHIQKTWKSWVE